MIDHPYLEKLRSKKIHLVGLASAEISAVADFLYAQGCRHLTAHDIYDGVEFKKAYRRSHLGLTRAQQVAGLKKLDSLPLIKYLGKNYLRGIEEADVIFPTQGWFLCPENRDQLQPLWDQGVEFGSLTKLYLQLAPAKIIGVTGTNGKGTTTHLITAMLQAGGKKVYLAGNDPHSIQVLDKLESMAATDYLVLEISNRQLLLDLGASPWLAVITNVTPNHLDEHHNLFAEYAEVKRSLLKDQTINDIVVLNFDNPTCLSFGKKSAARVFGFSIYKNISNGAMLKKKQLVYCDNTECVEIGTVADVKLPGDYNLENALAAVVVARQCQISPAVIRDALVNFRGLPQRLEFIRTVGGVKYYNDLFSTTPASTQRALEAFDQPVILIAGGDAKGVDYFSLAETIKGKVSQLWLFPGTASENLKKHLRTVHFDKIKEISDFDNCLQNIKKSAATGDIVLLSPGGAHFQSRFIAKKSSGFNAVVKSW
jgi:UDP-N-acetylmuramoylalanine--D-glutamate ligase